MRMRAVLLSLVLLLDLVGSPPTCLTAEPGPAPAKDKPAPAKDKPAPAKDKPAPAKDELAQRQQVALRTIARRQIKWSNENDVKLAHFIAQAKFAVGEDASARETIKLMLSRRPMVDYFDPEFPLWSAMDCYLRWKDVPGKYSDELRNLTQEFVAAAQVPSTATTYNHHWMLAAGLMLAYQEWGNEAVTYQYSDEDPTGRAWVEEQFDRIVTRSFPELLTDTYSRFNLGPILSLHNFSDDSVIRRKSRMVLDWILLQQAAYFFHGHAAGATRRTYFPLQKPNNALSPNWLYFGGPVESDGKLSVVNATFALSSYRPPALFHDLAWDRAQTYIQYGSRSTSTAERLTTFFDRSYAVFSQYPLRNDLGPRSTWHHEALQSGVRWITPSNGYSTLFVKHPCPKEPSQIGMPWLGDTEFHQVLQHRGTIIGVLNIPSKRPAAYREESWRNLMLGVFPNNHQALIDQADQARIYLHYGSVMIGICLTEPFKIQPASWPTRRGQANEFRIAGNEQGLQAGYVIATAPAKPSDALTAKQAAKQLAEWQERLAVSFDALEFSARNKFPRLRYRNLDNVVMDLTYRPKGTSSVRRLNGLDIPDIDDDARWPLIKNPWVEQAVGSKQLHIDYQDKQLTYDFQSWTISLDADGQPEGEDDTPK